MNEPEEFDPTVPVAEGVTVLEASAGTGKTHAVASLVVAEVALGRVLRELLVVTFTRKATGTLRERVWLRLSEAARALAPGSAAEPKDPLLVHLRRGSPDEVAQRRSNLQRAVSDFDAATIATTHGFCQHVLAGLGVAGDAERDLQLVDDLGDLVADAVDDLFVRRFHAGGEILFKRDTAVAIADAVIRNPDCEIGPVDPNKTDQLRRKFALTLRDRIIAQKRSGRIITYDDLLARLDTSIHDDERGEIVANRLRRRYTMAVVDEFQDTDSVQWRILHKAFGEPPNRLVLVGDPKQAIYAFRGGDVFAYLDATEQAQHRRTLPISWRADQPLLDAQDAIFAGAQLGDPSIRHRAVRARPGAAVSALRGSAVGPALKVRIAHRGSGAFSLTQYGWAMKASVRQFISDDLAAEAVRILHAGTTIEDRPVVPGDLAVLTRTHREAEAARDALHGVGVPAVVHGGSSVLATAAARHWLDLLRALELPASPTRVHGVAYGPFLGWDAARIAGAGDAEWEEVDGLLHSWSAAIRSNGVAGLLRRIETEADLTARVLGTVGGERRLSDLRHVAELLHVRQSAHPASTAVLAAWLAEQIADSQAGVDGTRRRLESDADAVAIQTVHGAKGLEFPIVLLPSVWDAPPEDDKMPVFHDEHGRRTIGVGGSGRTHVEQAAKASEERDDEELRLLYVSLTRAKHQVIVWWATANDAHRSAFARLLCGTDPATGVVQRKLPSKPDEATIAAELTKRGVAVEHAGGPTGARFEPAPDDVATLTVGQFDREFDRRWVRTSYSGLTHAAHDARGAGLDADMASTADAARGVDVVEAGDIAKGDEPVVRADATQFDDALAVPLPLGVIPGGARVGTLVHDVLERTDFSAADLLAELASACRETGARRILEGHVDALVAGLALVIDTPLGPDWGGHRLRDVRRNDRLDELNFDLPLAGGDHPDAALVTMDAIARVFASLPKDDPLAGYHERLGDPLLATGVRGFLNGSIDLVARVGDSHFIVDYKTNLLAPFGQEPLSWHYRPAALADAMQDAHYPLQAALYTAAIHRFLRWRLAGYDPRRHLGGVAYLFLRGMTGADTPTVDGRPCGVFAWHPPAAFVIALSDVLDRGAS